jgi:hypothetical protein
MAETLHSVIICQSWIQIEFLELPKHSVVKSPGPSYDAHNRMMAYVQEEVAGPV